MTHSFSETGGRVRDSAGTEQNPDLEEGIELPVEPDAGSVIPDDDDDERVINVPS